MFVHFIIDRYPRDQGYPRPSDYVKQPLPYSLSEIEKGYKFQPLIDNKIEQECFIIFESYRCCRNKDIKKELVYMCNQGFNTGKLKVNAVRCCIKYTK